ncbi:CDP-alcohol phosphatidyltransferase family protein [Thiobacillus sp.]|uniref:CDP-alcohol phosphatidyltransferase family protein n=1 Tax=Thiobacillus sp. TaxID=924 RepID=UPI0011DAEC98|nr:CDP-alcohol phosphatidyltransferase family protein [Thiobacillus sp.]MBC2730778.1 CDP-alcohol phosphatidyltransferase family protein [Thiobacillus sp.]MBC2739515.1 CDP-alcohol phosphatidyltransferase family protein [Thiobacillus sp.]MBC2760201.1 CDP-alcohol phosphatidyltransferase family protein [Thiobacillus sp.]TXH75182.1 MAG: CDP-alcohol phosphatidyltransferase family protein [Thiobacillus sp.]
MSERVFNLPNAITLLRLVAVPGVAWLILQQRWEAACWLFLAAAISDGVDGLLARWLKQMTQLGAALDTVADKALGVVTLVMLTQAGAIPLWVTLAILLRDSIVVLGALSYRGLAGHLDIHPTWLGKTHMFAELSLLSLVLGGLAGLLSLGDWLHAVFVAVFAIAVVSGVQYVWVWGAKARREREAIRLRPR